jgi:hypothetical protein
MCCQNCNNRRRGNARIFSGVNTVHYGIMSPKSQLRITNILMLAGTVPLGLGLAWIGTVIAYAQQHKGQMGGSDAFLMMGVLFVTYAFAVVVGGGSALWSAVLARRNPDLRARTASVLRWSTVIVLLLPVLCYLGMALSLR